MDDELVSEITEGWPEQANDAMKKTRFQTTLQSILLTFYCS